MPNSVSNNIQHVVVLMFENRSFDHILGAMPGVNGVLDANGNVKPELYNYYDPTNPDSYKQIPFAITPGASEAAYIVPTGQNEFNHDFTAMLNYHSGPGTTGIVNGQPVNNPWPTYPAGNCGFVNVNNVQHGGNGYPTQYPALSYFEWGSMQVFHALASQFVVCDNWFCDMPGHTAPNRAFMHCATTGDLQIDDNDAANESYPLGGAMVNSESIFERLQDCGATWKMYIPGDLNEVNSNNLDTDFLNTTVGNSYWTPQDPLPTNCTNVPLQQFCTDVQSGNLPTYSFIMCWNHVCQDTSMHPDSPVEAAENLLAGVYNTLRNSQHWNDTLLVVTFDENGGLYDHVRPPRAVPPNPGDAPQSWPPGSGTYTFDYSILGFRIPAILISPWLQTGIESQQLQNTSVLRFLQDMFCTSQPGSYLTQRDRFANSIQVAFDDFGLLTARTDCPQSMPTYPNIYFSDGICNSPQMCDLEVPPKAYMVQNTLEYVRGLPGHADSGKNVPRQFNTVRELADYAVERKKAAGFS